MRQSFLPLFFLVLLILAGCTLQPTKPLNELQEDACFMADKAGTCTTRLEELGIVTKEECCTMLGACCG